jgi:hypothetical protein
MLVSKLQCWGEYMLTYSSDDPNSNSENEGKNRHDEPYCWSVIILSL